jgi:Zn-dependent peptidase ImmA (M78 family)/transcriptional regulator with XRE-family HTH domain
MPSDPLENLDPKVLGERLRSARKAAGFTQDAAAENLGYARTTVVAIEKGDRKVDAGEIIRFARLYGKEVSDLVNVRKNHQPLVPQFRSGFAASSPGSELAFDKFMLVAEELEALAADYLELERLCEAPLPKDYPPIYRLEGSYNPPQELGEETAGVERSRLGLGDAPISDLRTILEDAVGLRVFYYPMPSPLAGVFACNDELGGCIGINSKHPSPRGNWTLAHEYGHFLTTRYQPDAVFETGGRWARTVNEQFADSFASNFLMPRSGVNRRFSELKDARQEKIRVADLFQLAQFYRVSIQAMVLRLEDLKRLPQGTWDKLRQRGLRPEQARTALGLTDPAGNRAMFPQRYLLLAKNAFEAGLISEGQLAKKLRTDRVTARVRMEELDDLIRENTGSDSNLLGEDLVLPNPP